MELLVVIGIIGLLIAIAFPAVQAARESARRSQCGSNQRQFGVAFLNFETSRKVFPSSLTFVVKGPQDNPQVALHNFMADLLPYFDEGGINAQFDHKTTFCDPVNAVAIAAPISVAICPSAPSRNLQPITNFTPSQLFSQIAKQDTVLGPLLIAADKKYSAAYSGAPTDYSVPVERGSMFPSPTADLTMNDVQAHVAALTRTGKVEFSLPLQAADIRDGLSHTLMLTEDAGRPQRWQAGIRVEGDDSLTSAWAAPSIGLQIASGTGNCFPQCDNDGKVYSFHSSGVNLLFADGHVEYFVAEGAASSIVALMTVNKRDNK